MSDFEIITRAEWGAKAPTQALSPMTQPDGWIVHYVGGQCLQDPTLSQSVAAVYRLQAEAFSGSNGETYIDIPYNFLIDLNGRIFEGRGFANKSGANGSSNYNGHAWAVCILMGPGPGEAGVPADRGNVLTAEAIDAVAWLTREGARRVGAVSYVKGHRDVYATHCPGDQAYNHVPVWHAHLHDAEPPPPVDWTKLAELIAWQQRVANDPLWEDLDPKHPVRPLDTKTMKALLKAQGYNINVDGVYGPEAVKDIADFKRKRHMANYDGTNCGGDCAAELLKKA